MNVCLLILILAVTALISLSGGVLLILGRGRIARKVQKWGPAIAFLVLMYAVFFDIVPEVLEELPVFNVMGLMLLGFLACALMGLLMGKYHHHSDLHHHGEHAETHGDKIKNKTQAYTMLLVDSVHAVADGVVLGTSFLAGMATGIPTCLATIAHEIPQEVGDFAIMQKAGFGAKKTILYQALSGLIIVPAGVVAYLVGEQLLEGLPMVLAVVAGFLLYVAIGELSCTVQMIKEDRQRH
ncbi:ZIP family metal transporter [Candidatus Saccharibacteria bacterium]|nr:ZIP family metal transporter [Candidatus Saccharibacteria bacterium]